MLSQFEDLPPKLNPTLERQWRRMRWMNIAAATTYGLLFVLAYFWLQARATDQSVLPTNAANQSLSWTNAANQSLFLANQLLLSRLLLATMAVHLIVIVLWQRKLWTYRLRQFFFEPLPPNRLALLRILVCGAIFVELVFTASHDYLALAGLPHESRQPLPLVGWLIDILPISPTLYSIFLVCGIACSLLAALGLWTRPMLLALIPLTFYLFGVPQFFGKMSHNQFYVWVPIILAFTPCGRFWSIDALIARLRGIRISHKPSFEYALGIRWLMLAMVGIYFFSGVHKLYDVGLYWALSDNPVNLLRTEWLEQFQDVPWLRVDKLPWLCNAAAVGVIVFELAYPFMLLGRSSRNVLAFTTIGFHTLNGYFLKIDFTYLKAAHLTYFPVERAVQWLRRKVRRWMAWLLVLAFLGVFGWMVGAAYLILPVIVGAIVNIVWHGIGLRKRVQFLIALRKRFFSRSLSISPTLPSILIAPSAPAPTTIPAVPSGPAIPTVPSRSAKPNAIHLQQSAKWLRLSFITGIALVSINWTFSALGINSWPFSAYPSYTFVREATVQYAWFIPVTAVGEILDLDAEAKAIGFRKENILPMAERVVSSFKSEPKSMQVAILQYWLRWQTEVPRLNDAVKASVVIREFPLDPDARESFINEIDLGEVKLVNGKWTFWPVNLRVH